MRILFLSHTIFVYTIHYYYYLTDGVLYKKTFIHIIIFFSIYKFLFCCFPPAYIYFFLFIPRSLYYVFFISSVFLFILISIIIGIYGRNAFIIINFFVHAFACILCFSSCQALYIYFSIYKY